jgi:hypothetical protein
MGKSNFTPFLASNKIELNYLSPRPVVRGQNFGS